MAFPFAPGSLALHTLVDPVLLGDVLLGSPGTCCCDSHSVDLLQGEGRINHCMLTTNQAPSVGQFDLVYDGVYSLFETVACFPL